MGVVTKRRSSSYRLQRVIRRYDAFELAGSISMMLAFVRSETNPADKPSRLRFVRQGMLRHAPTKNAYSTVLAPSTAGAIAGVLGLFETPALLPLRSRGISSRSLGSMHS